MREMGYCAGIFDFTWLFILLENAAGSLITPKVFEQLTRFPG
jgi:hypothetical protein